MKTAALTLTTALGAIYPLDLQAQIVTCPQGTYLSVDQLGMPNCLQAADGHSLAIIQGGPTVICPSSTYPTVDDYGNRVCKSLDQRGPTYYGYPSNSNARGTNSQTPNSGTSTCPAGTFPAGVGITGNQICRQM